MIGCDVCSGRVVICKNNNAAWLDEEVIWTAPTEEL